MSLFVKDAPTASLAPSSSPLSLAVVLRKLIPYLMTAQDWPTGKPIAAIAIINATCGVVSDSSELAATAAGSIIFGEILISILH